MRLHYTFGPAVCGVAIGSGVGDLILATQATHNSGFLIFSTVWAVCQIILGGLAWAGFLTRKD
jgi:hypothetical protein